MSEHSYPTPSRMETVDRGRRDPEYPHRPVLPWRNRTIENYTITCPRCGSYKLDPPHVVSVISTSANIILECRDCGAQFGLGVFKTNNGVMLATD